MSRVCGKQTFKVDEYKKFVIMCNDCGSDDVKIGCDLDEEYEPRGYIACNVCSNVEVEEK